ncbi:uncharacterized protein LOC108034313 [Drosophila biarmipes]|uniref:uncharacterized protein LOC108034313 n=1 Tax=Drosophila biarmipes TaxID=125945 RepID=UPI0007E6E0CB|nr:uncharacterized protein LOC108034313 [Drosophila biarmipes]
MLRTFAILLLIVVAVNARAAPQRTTVSPDYETTEDVEVVEQSTYMAVEEGTITVDVDSDVILTTSPEGEAFTEASPMGLTEEPLPDSVVQQLEMEREQEERLKNPEEPEAEQESESENEELDATTTEPPNPNNTASTNRRSFKFGATTLPPSFITTTEKATTTIAPQEVTTSPPSETEETTEFQEVQTMRNYFERKPAPMGEIDLDMAENRMETTTNTPAQEPMELSMIMTTEAALVEGSPKPKSEGDQAESVETTVVPLYQSVSNGAPIVTEPQPEHSTVLPEVQEEVASTEGSLDEIKELLLVSSTPAPETTTEAEVTTAPAPSTTTTTTTEAPLLTTNVETLLNFQPETTNSAPETTTTSVPQTTTSSTSAPTTTSTTSTTSAPTTTTSTTTTTTERPVQTRAPRVERIFNSDGVEVLYGYSSVVRTNRS